MYDFIQNKEVVSGFLAGMEADEKGAQTYKWYNSKTYPYLSRREVDERTMVRK